MTGERVEVPEVRYNFDRPLNEITPELQERKKKIKKLTENQFGNNPTLKREMNQPPSCNIDFPSEIVPKSMKLVNTFEFSPVQFYKFNFYHNDRITIVNLNSLCDPRSIPPYFEKMTEYLSNSEIYNKNKNKKEYSI